MPTRRLPDPSDDQKWDYARELPCFNPEHRPPMHQNFRPGRYEHTCPACGKKTYFTVPAITSGPQWWTSR